MSLNMRLGNYSGLCVCFLVACSQSNNFSSHLCHDDFMCTDNNTIIAWNNPSIKMSFENSAPPPLRLAMKQASTDYNDNFSKVKFNLDENDTSAPAYKNNYEALNRDGVNSVYYVTGTWPWETKIPGSLAVTLTRDDANGIIEADVFIKADASKYELSDTDAVQQNILPWIKYICEHELGHVLGRAHSKKTDSLMYPSVSMSKVTALVDAVGYQDFFSTYDLAQFDLAYPNP